MWHFQAPRTKWIFGSCNFFFFTYIKSFFLFIKLWFQIFFPYIYICIRQSIISFSYSITYKRRKKQRKSRHLASHISYSSRAYLHKNLKTPQKLLMKFETLICTLTPLQTPFFRSFIKNFNLPLHKGGELNNGFTCRVTSRILVQCPESSKRALFAKFYPGISWNRLFGGKRYIFCQILQGAGPDYRTLIFHLDFSLTCEFRNNITLWR